MLRIRGLRMSAAYLCLVGIHAYADPPAPPKPGFPLTLHFNASNEGKVEADWVPMEGSPAVSVVKLGGVGVLRMPCRFAGTGIERASWDLPIKLDLSGCRGVRLQILCTDLSPISHCTLYFQSGGGWYGLEFTPDRSGGWSTVTLDKDRANAEGRPDDWSKVSLIRLSAWRAADVDTEIYLAGMGLLGLDAQIAVVDGRSVVQSDGRQNRAVSENRRRVVGWLDDLDLNRVVIEDGHLTSETLKGRQLVILPFNPAIPAAAGDALTRFVESGGKVIAFRHLPQPLAQLAEGKGKGSILLHEERAAQPGELLDMMSQLTPLIWQDAVARSIERIGRLGALTSFDASETAIRALAPAGSEAVRRLESAGQIRDTAKGLYVAGKYAQAMSAARQAQSLMVESFGLAQQPRPGEQRGFWCHSAFGVDQMPWDAAIRILAENGFTAILPNMLWGGVAYYNSKVLPVAPEVAQRGDQIAECVTACRKYGIQCHVWKVNWNMSWRAPKEFVDRMKKEGRTQIRFDGNAEDQWLCPSHPANQQLEIDAMVEVATQYSVDGVHFDYIRYPGAEACFCSGCRERFEKLVGSPVPNWPADLRKDGPVRDRWLEFRRDNITKVVATVAETVHKTRPKVKVSAAVFPNWPADRDTIGQDWSLWCRNGYLDFVCPMDYTSSNGQFESFVKRQLEWAGKTPCCPGIGLSVWPDPKDTVKLAEQINIVRKLGASGFTVFNYSVPEANEIVPFCGLGITRK
ncbi:MAG TPA: family 10 glycosylhydrolase [Phycisphaerae bacterium]|nr:family 10 glycosylhydrolase [Phycisphaerae bacterium]HRY68744.1 family 10 glycosylhydrolase [Phycisphaerae bacterium]HSA29601.1 family 10 glycosylhydrolase [Phycisphaerae bacterium]